MTYDAYVREWHEDLKEAWLELPQPRCSFSDFCWECFESYNEPMI